MHRLLASAKLSHPCSRSIHSASNPAFRARRTVCALLEILLLKTLHSLLFCAQFWTLLTIADMSGVSRLYGELMRTTKRIQISLFDFTSLVSFNVLSTSSREGSHICSSHLGRTNIPSQVGKLDHRAGMLRRRL